ncbi:hypothetical protein EZS27_006071 [termite gut metagenome]|jgi:hypothetical protein|uniref:Uncharacterized protein n=1 Tax=termite gut metagenome TaxID=433724 RepID=A0A5J4SLY8_9ZZZZ
MIYKGLSYASRVKAVNEIYEQHAKSGLSNREIWRRYVYPVYFISEVTFYNYLNASAETNLLDEVKQIQLSLF